MTRPGVTRGLADTTVFIARDSRRPVNVEALPDELTVSIITIGELRAGVLATDDLDTRDQRLATLTHALAMAPVPVDDAVARAWARLRVVLRDHGQRMPLNDSWIAASAWSRRLPVVTQDHDYVEIPGLEVIRV
ncbi:MAG: type II toxin-antitoxin system VapC family toxin [Acidimicrobiales bacterium]